MRILILEKTEGIPFFIEEFVRSLRDLDIITGTEKHYFLATEIKGVTIPSTIQEMIMARVDSLARGCERGPADRFSYREGVQSRIDKGRKWPARG